MTWVLLFSSVKRWGICETCLGLQSPLAVVSLHPTHHSVLTDRALQSGEYQPGLPWCSRMPEICGQRAMKGPQQNGSSFHIASGTLLCTQKAVITSWFQSGPKNSVAFHEHFPVRPFSALVLERRPLGCSSCLALDGKAGRNGEQMFPFMSTYSCRRPNETIEPCGLVWSGSTNPDMQQHSRVPDSCCSQSSLASPSSQRPGIERGISYMEA